LFNLSFFFLLVFSYKAFLYFILSLTCFIYPPSVMYTFDCRKQAEVFVRGPGYDSYSLSVLFQEGIKPRLRNYYVFT